MKNHERRKGHRRQILIAATIDYRGVNDDILTFVFRGASLELITEVFRLLIGKGHGIADRAKVMEEHDIIRRNGKGYWRVAAEIQEPDFNFCSLPDMQILIEAIIRRLHPATVHWLSLDKFLNV